jgi:hypothetical protein
VFLNAVFGKTRVFVGFCVWAALMLPRVKCGELYVFFYVFEAEAVHEARVDVVWRSEARLTKIE